MLGNMFFQKDIQDNFMGTNEKCISDIFNETFNNEIEFIKVKFGNKKRMDGKLKYTHSIKVAKILFEKGFSNKIIKIALFHDLIEDTGTTYEEILEIAGEDIANCIKILTKESGYNMKEYIKRINQDYRCHMVKLADRLHNLISANARIDDIEFIENQVIETKEYFLDLSKGTVFEYDINKAYTQLKKKLIIRRFNNRRFAEFLTTIKLIR